MMFENELIKLISDHMKVKCFLDVVPEKAFLPACGLTTIGQSPLTQRELSGKRIGRAIEYRLSLCAASMPELNSLVNRVELLDNTKHADFQRIWLDFSSREPYQGDEKVFRVYYNLTAVK